MYELIPKIFEALRVMDRESRRNEIIYGLNDYGRFARPESKRPQCEVEWSRRLARLLVPNTESVAVEKAYPALPGKRCDLFWKSDGKKTWLEVKGSWRDYWNGKGPYLSHLLNPLIAGLDASKTHSAALDLVKLNSLGTAADWIAELIVGFENPNDPMDREIQQFVQLANLSQWEAASDSWTSAIGLQQRVRCFIWFRRVKDTWDMPAALKQCVSVSNDG